MSLHISVRLCSALLRWTCIPPRFFSNAVPALSCQDTFTQTSQASDWPNPIHSSSRLTLHKSVFKAYVSSLPPLFLCQHHGEAQGLSSTPVNSFASASAVEVTRRLDRFFEELERTNSQAKRASHCMYAWRITVPKAISGPPPESGPRPKPKRVPASSNLPSAITSPREQVVSGSVSGGESGAGERLERLLELSPDCKGRDVVLVVYRWYGGVKLGSDRWKCISMVAKEALGVASGMAWR
ncbi:uncharacterized protein PHACADRAFT_260607 [Phanerochaete carnosa HHB-10118-sp]|uniref:Impact N-terminal domain-containing protein n=1 Tax=Phanerochaete carnosa (strain HHB-10118-sp) TaxID=650164 RepID=K5VZS0_PHACS|nr:uncharacterized protein PHACADRAFT_260607 [Phanerochaete carnosa HHB-10118-sp]EKM52300.1 hypothetical protein PHACADRAFT_260607 [Phanerochaete carnosa HHB-10118-sp]